MCTHTHTLTHMRAYLNTHTYIRVHMSPGWLMHTKGVVSSPYPPCDIVMPQFSRHKRDDDEWYSQPFYSAPGGYKLCLCVHANGRSIGHGTHVIVGVGLMEGDDDHKLQWPFEHDVMYRIINWKRDENHVIDTIHFKKAPTTSKARVTSSRMASTAFGHFKVLSHALMYDNQDQHLQYLNYDCLYLQVLKVESPK